MSEHTDTTATTADVLDLPLAAFRASGITSVHWTQETLTLRDLRSRAMHPHNRKRCPAYVLGSFLGERRTKRAVQTRSALVLDVDELAAVAPMDPSDGLERCNLPQVADELRSLGVAVLAHETYSSTDAEPRLRIIIPLHREVPAAAYRALSEAVTRDLRTVMVDPGSHQAERGIYEPARPGGGAGWVVYASGDPLDWEHGRWRVDAPERPADQAPSGPDLPETRQDPREAGGVVGAFCRAHTLASVVDEYLLPYEPTPDLEMWKLAGSHGPGGLHALLGADGALWYDHHATSRTHGQALSLWDLVAEHAFGYLDDAEGERRKPTNDRASRRELARVAASDPRVVAQSLPPMPEPVDDSPPASAEDVAREDSEPEEDSGRTESDEESSDQDRSLTSWVRERLVRHSKTLRALDDPRNWDLIQEHDPVLARLGYDRRTEQQEWLSSPPWRDVSESSAEVSTWDLREVGHYLRAAYGTDRVPEAEVERLVAACADRRAFHPVRDWLESLEWDGTPRLDTCLPGTRGDESRATETDRLIARLALVGAAARVLDPGCKVDHVLVLVGGQGVGKTWWVERMSRGFTTGLGPIDSRDTLMSAHRSWIVTADEGFTMGRADSERLKAFITTREDAYRAPYARAVTVRKRPFVVWATTNDRGFLRQEDGNRRYLPHEVPERLRFDLYTDEYIDQVWAEAVALYRSGERPLWATPEEQELLGVAQERHTAEDIYASRIEGLLDTLVPEGWPTWGPERQLEWLRASAMGYASEAGTHHITQVSAATVYAMLGRDWRENRDRSVMSTIRRTIHALPEWERSEDRVLIPGLGRQRVWRRVTPLGDYTHTPHPGAPTAHVGTLDTPTDPVTKEVHYADHTDHPGRPDPGDARGAAQRPGEPGGCEPGGDDAPGAQASEALDQAEAGHREDRGAGSGDDGVFNLDDDPLLA